MLQQMLYQLSELHSVLFFPSSDWHLPIIWISLAISVFYSWNLGSASAKQISWLEKNKDLIAQYHALQLQLNNFGQDLSSCKNCNARDMQLWNFQKQLLVVRCSSCKMNYTFTKGQNQLILKVLLQIESVMVLFNTLISYKHHPFGRLLASELKVDITELTTATTPLELIHFTAQSESMMTPISSKNIAVHQCEIVQPVRIARLAS